MKSERKYIMDDPFLILQNGAITKRIPLPKTTLKIKVTLVRIFFMILLTLAVNI